MNALMHALSIFHGRSGLLSIRKIPKYSRRAALFIVRISTIEEVFY